MNATIDRNKLAVSNEYGHFNRRVLSHGDIVRYLRRENETSLPKWDLWGYEIAYYIATPSTIGYTNQWTGFVNGELAVRDLTGDVLCGDCAASMVSDDELVHVAYQCNGEIGDEETVYCDHCRCEIYTAPDN